VPGNDGVLNNLGYYITGNFRDLYRLLRMVKLVATGRLQ
jgi:hypothetical protein